MASTASPRITQPILIVGAGIGGLLLAHGLKRHSIPYRIFERDSTPNARTQGYRFRVAPEGYAALRAILDDRLIVQLEELAPRSFDGTDHETKFWDAISGESTERFMSKGKGAQGRQHDILGLADRKIMRTILLQDTGVEFGWQLDSYRNSDDNSGIVARFTNGTEVAGSMLIGADGSTSKVRAQLMPHYKLLHTTGRWTWGKTPATEELYASIKPELVNGFHIVRDLSHPNDPVTIVFEMTHFAPDPARCGDLLDDVQPLQDYIAWTLMSSTKHAELPDEELLKLGPADRVKETLRLTQHWRPEFRALIEKQIPSASAIYKVVSAPPQIPTWTGRGRVTLIGDAAHTMVATAAAGASTAMRDAREIVEALLEGGAELSGNDDDGEGVDEKGLVARAIERYEGRMRVYAEEVIRSSDERAQRAFGMKALDEMVREQLDDTDEAAK